MAEVSLSKVNLQRRIPEHNINFTYALIVKIAYLSYCIQYDVIVIIVKIIIIIIIIIIIKAIVLYFVYFVVNFAIIFGFICLFQRRMPTNGCIIYFSIKRSNGSKDLI